MLPGTYDLQLYRGDTARLRFTLWNDEAKTLPLNLSGATVDSQIRDAPDTVTVLHLTCAVVLPNNIDVTVPTAAAATLNEAGGVWDLQITWPSGDVQTVVAGAVYVTPDVTRSL